MNISLPRLAKGIAGVIVIVVLFSMVTRWWGTYRQTVSANGRETTQTAPPAGEGGAGSSETTKKAGSTKKPTQVVVLTDGLNFRDQASREGNKIRGLKKGEKLELIKTQGSWYYVEDRSGKRGWISASSSYSRVVK